MTLSNYGDAFPKSICECGHSGDGESSQHYKLKYAAHSSEPGHGYCLVYGCPCKKFRWKAFLPLYKARLAAEHNSK